MLSTEESVSKPEYVDSFNCLVSSRAKSRRRNRADACASVDQLAGETEHVIASRIARVRRESGRYEENTHGCTVIHR